MLKVSVYLYKNQSMKFSILKKRKHIEVFVKMSVFFFGKIKFQKFFFYVISQKPSLSQSLTFKCLVAPKHMQQLFVCLFIHS